MKVGHCVVIPMDTRFSKKSESRSAVSPLSEGDDKIDSEGRVGEGNSFEGSGEVLE